jgi:hypothetical protein
MVDKTAAKLTTYVPPPQPTLGGDQLYLQQQLAALASATSTLNAAIRKLEARLVAGGL